jgi:hypothetical protein
MKELGRFVSYCWSSWEWWQKSLIINILLQAASWLFPQPYQTWVSGLGWAILIAVFVHFWWKEMFLTKWTKYRQHRNELLTTIKDSDK